MLICVDLDGTLLDTVPANAASYRAALEELGFTVTDEYYAERCNGGHYTRFLPPLMGGTPSTADVERVHDRKKALYSDFLDVVRPNTALMEILRTMQAAGHDLACVTTGSKQNATEVLEHFGVRELFGLICYCLSSCRLFLRHSPFGCCACSARMAWQKRGLFAVHLLWPWLGCGCSICTLPQHFPDVQRSRCWISGATRRGRQM